MSAIKILQQLVLHRQQKPDESFEAFVAVMFQVEVFWSVSPCCVVVGHQCFRGSCHLQLQGEAARISDDILPQYYTASHPRISRLRKISNPPENLLNSIIQQLLDFIYLWSGISYWADCDGTSETHWCQGI